MLTKIVCTFKIYYHGISGNELPPPVIKVASWSVLCEENESPRNFKDRMDKDGREMRSMMAEHFKKHPEKYDHYSTADTVDWSYSTVHQEIMETLKAVYS